MSGTTKSLSGLAKEFGISYEALADTRQLRFQSRYYGSRIFFSQPIITFPIKMGIEESA